MPRWATPPALALLLAGAPLDAYAQEPPPRAAPDSVHALEPLVIELDRLGMAGVPGTRVPFGAQRITLPPAEPIAGLTVADLLSDLVGVSTADELGSPLQPDLTFRGFQASPVIGMPQGVSVFVDGVRVNEPTASEVNFDLIPLDDVARIELLRGPSGAFGRNTLAGALNIVTRRGGTAGSALEARAGSYGLRKVAGRAAGAAAGFDYYGSARYVEAAGWRQDAFSRLLQLFTKVGWSGADTDVWASYTFALDSLQQAGSLPASWLRDPATVPARFGQADPRTLNFTGGDAYDPRLHFVNTRLERRLSAAARLAAGAFLRDSRISQFNANFLEPDTRIESAARSVGAMVQLAWSGALVDATAGLEYAWHDLDIEIFDHPNPNHPSVPPAGRLAEDVGTVERDAGVYAQLRVRPRERLGLHLTLRYDDIDLPFHDRLEPSNDGENRFRLLSGGAGIDLALGRSTAAFASYGRGFRAPVLLELACADPDDPCPLPFELGADPPLDAVTADTWQLGLRRVDPRAGFELVGYWSEVHDEIFNVQPLDARVGFFQNIDRTRRVGLEASASAVAPGRLRVSASLALTRATFETHATLSAPYIEADDDAAEQGAEPEPAPAAEPAGELAPPTVAPGDAMPMVPRLRGRVELGRGWGGLRLSAAAAWTSEQWLRGDEDNTERALRLEDYWVAEASAAYTRGDYTAFLEIENLLDTEYSSFGVLALNRLDAGPDRVEPFLTPGPPRRIEAGLRWSPR